MKIKLLDDLINTLAKLPGLGPRSARRIALHLIQSPQANMLPLADKLIKVGEAIKTCKTCGNYDTEEYCHICNDKNRDESIICIVETIADVWAIERSSSFNGTYHILGGVLSAIDGITPEKLNINSVLTRLSSDAVKEVIIATNPTLEGQSTGFYVADIIAANSNVKISRLAHGIPVGAELDVIDSGTLAIALKGRS